MHLSLISNTNILQVVLLFLEMQSYSEYFVNLKGPDDDWNYWEKPNWQKCGSLMEQPLGAEATLRFLEEKQKDQEQPPLGEEIGYNLQTNQMKTWRMKKMKIKVCLIVCTTHITVQVQ